MRLLELFCGTKSVGLVAKELGWEVFSSDILEEFSPDYVIDMLDFDFNKVPWVPDVIWASPPCTYFTVMQIGRNWTKDHQPKTDGAQHGVRLVEKTEEIIKYFTNKNSNLLYYIENPVAKLRKLPCIQWCERRVTVTYCQYGFNRRKATDIWTNDCLWVAKPICKNGDSCHVSAPRGSITGTQGLSKHEAYKIPRELSIEILKSAKNNFKEM